MMFSFNAASPGLVRATGREGLVGRQGISISSISWGRAVRIRISRAARFAEVWCARHTPDKPVAQWTAREREEMKNLLHHWPLDFSGTEGYPKAEVTLGGVDTRDLSSKTMEARAVPGLYFIGEVVDVTGWLGGYNFQWAWASGVAAGEAI
jgi:predicted flavoprotein YhiN